MNIHPVLNSLAFSKKVSSSLRSDRSGNRPESPQLLHIRFDCNRSFFLCNQFPEIYFTNFRGLLFVCRLANPGP
jgi:hypothetical protein